MYCPKEIQEILLTEEEIKARVAEIGGQLTEEYKEKNPLFLCILKGSTIFYADLVRQMACPVELDFIRASSYRSQSVSNGDVDIDGLDGKMFSGRHVVVVEDIIDTAKTLSKLKAHILSTEPASLKLVTLLDKPDRRVIKGFDADLTGFTIPDHFVVGYGLDFAERFRNLPYVGVLKPSAYSNT